MTEAVVTIEKLAFGGNGVGRIDGKVCFVPFSCPGDRLRVSITKDKRSYLIADILEIITPAPQRIVPPCQIFNSCGGCSWQHIDYAQQLTEKHSILTEILWRGARVEADCIKPVVASTNQYGYRSRVQCKVQTIADTLHIGFYRHGTHTVEDAPRGCPVALPAINEALQRLRLILQDFREKSLIHQIHFDSGEQELIAVIEYAGREQSHVVDFFRAHCNKLNPLTGIYLQNGGKKSLVKIFGDERIFYSLPYSHDTESTCKLAYQPGGFAQINRPQNAAMLEIVHQLANFRPEQRVLDLFCGNGNFSLPISGAVASVTGIEGFQGSVTSAIENCRANNITNVEFFCCEARQGLQKLITSGLTFDTVLLDPPRSGAADLMTDICHLNPGTIVYISCDPSTLARDSGLLSGLGYSVKECVPVDMFPQTYHLETVTLLQKTL